MRLAREQHEQATRDAVNRIQYLRLVIPNYKKMLNLSANFDFNLELYRNHNKNNNNNNFKSKNNRHTILKITKRTPLLNIPKKGKQKRELPNRLKKFLTRRTVFITKFHIPQTR